MYHHLQHWPCVAHWLLSLVNTEVVSNAVFSVYKSVEEEKPCLAELAAPGAREGVGLEQSQLCVLGWRSEHWRGALCTGGLYVLGALCTVGEEELHNWLLRGQGGWSGAESALCTGGGLSTGEGLCVLEGSMYWGALYWGEREDEFSVYWGQSEEVVWKRWENSLLWREGGEGSSVYWRERP